MQKYYNILALAAVVSLAASLTAQAQLLTSESFNYTPGPGNPSAGPLVGQNGGTGWFTAWSDKGNLSEIAGTTLTYTDGNGNTTGSGNTLVETNYTTATTIDPQRTIGTVSGTTFGTDAAANSAAPGTIWMSYLWQGLNTTGGGAGNYRQAGIMFLKGTTEYLDIGMPNIAGNNISPNFSLWGANGNSPVYTSTAPLQSTVAANGGNTLFVLIEMLVDNTTASDTINIWLDPTLGAAPVGAPQITFNGQDLTPINNIRFQASAVNGTYNIGGEQAVGQILIGDTVGDVEPIPEPASMALVGLGGLGLLGLKRQMRK